MAKVKIIPGSYTINLDVVDNINVRVYYPVDIRTNSLLMPVQNGTIFTTITAVGYLISKTIIFPTGEYYPLAFEFIPILTLPPVVGAGEPLTTNMYTFYLQKMKKYIVISSEGNIPSSALWALASFLPLDYSSAALPMFPEQTDIIEQINTIMPAIVIIRTKKPLRNIKQIAHELEPFSTGQTLNTKLFLFNSNSPYSVAHIIRGVRGDYSPALTHNSWIFADSLNEALRYTPEFIRGTRGIQGAHTKDITQILAKEIERTPLWFSYTSGNTQVTVIGEMKYDTVLHLINHDLFENLSKENPTLRKLLKKEQIEIDKIIYDKIYPLIAGILSSLIAHGASLFSIRFSHLFLTSIDYPFENVYALLGGSLPEQTNSLPYAYFIPTTPSRKITSYYVEGIGLRDIPSLAHYSGANV